MNIYTLYKLVFILQWTIIFNYTISFCGVSSCDWNAKTLALNISATSNQNTAVNAQQMFIFYIGVLHQRPMNLQVKFGSQNWTGFQNKPCFTKLRNRIRRRRKRERELSRKIESMI